MKWTDNQVRWNSDVYYFVQVPLMLALLSPKEFVATSAFNTVLNEVWRRFGGVFDKEARSWKLPMSRYQVRLPYWFLRYVLHPVDLAHRLIVTLDSVRTRRTLFGNCGLSKRRSWPSNSFPNLSSRQSLPRRGPPCRTIASTDARLTSSPPHDASVI